MPLCYVLLLLSVNQIIANNIPLGGRDGPDELIINTTGGRVRGTEGKTVDLGKPYFAFRGIPYAEPPIGNLRFEPPRNVTPWSGILNATIDKEKCVQLNPPEGSEDCLFVNVYTPRLPSESGKTSLLPIMVWIYGGGFTSGNSSYNLYGPDYFLDQEVVFVSFNYRLGIFGFLSTGDLVAPGNTGLKDQVFLFKWVRNNIARFGGDLNKITIIGESAGSASVSYQLQSPLSEGLFRSAIMESGTSLCLWGLSRNSNAKLASFQTGILLGLNATTSEALVSGLKNVDYVSLQQVSGLVGNLLTLKDELAGLIFAPVSEPSHDGAFFTGKSHVQLQEGNFHRVPVIIGFNSLEGKYFLNDLNRLYLIRYDIDPSGLPPADMNINSSSVLATVGTKIHQYYWNDSTTIALPLNATIFVSDDQFNRPIRETARLLSSYSPVYFYLFSYVGILGDDVNSAERGTQHTEELRYLFVNNGTATPHDILARKRLVTLWANFVKSGNPTPKKEQLFENVTWPVTARSSNDTTLQYLDFGYNLKIKVNPFEKRLRFWNNLYASYGHPPYDTY